MRQLVQRPGHSAIFERRVFRAPNCPSVLATPGRSKVRQRSPTFRQQEKQQTMRVPDHAAVASPRRQRRLGVCRCVSTRLASSRRPSSDCDSRRPRRPRRPRVLTGVDRLKRVRTGLGLVVWKAEQPLGERADLMDTGPSPPGDADEHGRPRFLYGVFGGGGKRPAACLVARA